ncbi:MAG TPA: acetyl-CoA hydrolase/transferase C-terminal domain-containing protein [Intrasporangium sp.]|uniref:acetyl-CoA hydrolase/transferase family protein n=1 Tax=Intrasporangium sp. TaxID=1925024 RepID=UPI002D78AF4E|nr:acetyl-CoA hydrolase/transferase C-terminal domain-containing protein [Intrasporangium sp.]HET7399097.1 acetyl-CoA hydrolase/transferase C-terminal domain-containing protein [Intrasporangium sp.]
MIDLSRHVSPGAGIWWSQTSAEPTPLVHALLDQVRDIGPVRAFVGLTWDRRLTRDLPPEVSVVSYGGLGELRTLARAGRLDVVPCHYGALPRLFAEGRLPSDVGLVQVSPPDADGLVSLGVGVDYIADAIEHTPVLIAEINHRMPPTRGSARIPLSRFAAVVETDRPLLEAPERPGDAVEAAIARHVAGLVDDGDTIQIGVGTLPSAVLEALSGHTDLGLHSGLMSDAVLRLVDKGVLTGARKQIDPGVLVTGAALGSTALYERVADLPALFRPASYTHSPAVLSQLTSLVSINSAIEVDLTGQVGAEVAGDTYVGAVGGQVDFSRAASRTGARSIIALRSTVKGVSTIKVALDFGAVTTARADVDHVVTEHGAAELRGVGLAERARRLIAVAAPEHREELEKAFMPTELAP